MKSIIELEQNIILKVLSHADKHFLTISTILFSDISTGKLSPRGEFWDKTQGLIRQNQTLDEGYSKPNGECIVYGNCYSKIPTTVKEAGFYIKQHNLKKYLDIIGDRTLTKNFIGKVTLSEPEQFTKMKISYENSYGGEKFLKNPVGKGYYKNFKRKSTVHFHNIDKKENLTLSYKDEGATPYAFEAISMDWKQRIKKLGTYDDEWQKTYFPYFAKDLNYEAFQTVPLDQQIQGYFTGDETFEVYNMHPVKEKLEGRLPLKKIKTFVTTHTDDSKEKTFMELETNLDTIILFPEIEKVATVYRAMIPIKDDEPDEIEKIFTVTESLEAEKNDLEYYKALMQKRIDDPLDMEKQTFKPPEINKFIDLQDMAMYSEISLQKSLNQIPTISPSASSYKKMQEQYASLIDTQLQRPDLDAKTQKSLNILKELTHKDHFSTFMDNQIDSLKNNASSKDKMQTLQKKFPKVNLEKTMSTEIEKIKNTDEVKALGGDFESILINNWNDGARFLLGDANYNLQNSSEIYKEIKKLGLRDITINQILYIGYHEKDITIPAIKWQIEGEDIFIPSGFILGYFENNTISKLVVRKNIFDEEMNYIGDSQDIIIQGSKEKFDFIINGLVKEYIVLVDEILEAYLLYQDIWQISTIMLVKTKEEFIESDFFKKSKDTITHIFTTKFELELDIPTITVHNLKIDKNIYHEYTNNRDLENEILNLLPPTQYTHQAKKEYKKKKKQGSKYVGSVNIKMQEDRIKSYYTNKAKDGFENKEILSNLDEESKDKIATQLTNLTNLIKQKPKIPFENENAMHEALNNNLKKMYKENPSESVKKQIKKFMSNFQAFKPKSEKIEDRISPSLKKQFKKQFDTDLDKDDVTFYTQEDFIQTLILTDDLSTSTFYIESIEERCFFNIDFKRNSWENIICTNIHFNNCNFKETNFKDVVFEKCSFNNCNFEDTIFKSCEFFTTSIKNCTFDKAIIDNVIFDSCTIEDSLMNNVTFTDTEIQSCEYLNVNFGDSMFSSVTILTTTIFKSSLVNSMFVTSLIQASYCKENNFSTSTFVETTLDNIDFTKSNISNVMFSDETKLKNILFTHTNLDTTCIKELELENCDFTQASIQQSMIETCVLLNCNFTKSNATEANFKKSQFHSCTIQDINLRSGNLTKATFLDTTVYNSNLYECMIFKTSFNNSSFKDCNLEKTNLAKHQEK